MRPAQPRFVILAILLGLTTVSCATQSEKAGFNTFLEQLARDCKPLIIGADNFGQAIVFNGLGADQDHYNNFLSKTQGLYYGGISPELYRNTLTAFIGSGNYNERSFNCIFAHVPKKENP